MEEVQLEKAIKILKQGGIVIFPTDTAFGIGCRMDDENAVARLFKIRKRPETQATPVLIDNLEMAQEYLEPIPMKVREQLMDKYWPGALTIILRCDNKKVPKLVRGGKNTLGIRLPDHPVTRALIQGVKVPLLGPSANFHDGRTPFMLEDLDNELVQLVDFIVPGRCKGKTVSTVIDCSVKPWRVVREGALRI